MGPTLLLSTWLSKEKELIANSNKEPQFYCNNKGAYTTSIHVYIIVFFNFLLLLFPSQPCQMVTCFVFLIKTTKLTTNINTISN